MTAKKHSPVAKTAPDSGPGTKHRRSPIAGAGAIERRIAGADWNRLEKEIDEAGHVVLAALLSPVEATDLSQSFERAELFRNRVVMERHGYGRGEYRYFAYPLPKVVAVLRERLYERLAPVASRWAELRGAAAFPPTLHEYTRRCHAAGQTRPTPLVLRYREGDYNRLHQDLYGGEVFPLQVTMLLSRPGDDFDGGEFVLTEQRARMQSRVTVVPLALGDAVIFAVRDRPMRTARGVSRAMMRHGVSMLRRGERIAAGIIFHDAS